MLSSASFSGYCLFIMFFDLYCLCSINSMSFNSTLVYAIGEHPAAVMKSSLKHSKNHTRVIVKYRHGDEDTGGRMMNTPVKCENLNPRHF